MTHICGYRVGESIDLLIQAVKNCFWHPITWFLLRFYGEPNTMVDLRKQYFLSSPRLRFDFTLASSLGPWYPGWAWLLVVPTALK